MSDFVPAEIRRIAEETQKIEDELFKKQSATDPTGPTGPIEGEGETGPTGATGEQHEPEPTGPTGPTGSTEPVEDTTVEGKKPEDFGHKYKVLQGKYNKELPRERDARKAAEDKLLSAEYDNSVLRKQIADLANKLETHEKDGGIKKESVDDTQSISDMLGELESDPEVAFVKNEFPDVWKGFKKAFSKGYTKLAEGTASKISKVEEKVKATEETAAKTNWINFHKYLDDNVKGWRVVNKDSEFARWLEIPEDYSGLPKTVLIKQAISEMDSERVAKFFIDFAKSKEKPLKEGGSPPEKIDDKITKPVELAPPKSRKTEPPSRKTDISTEIITQENIAAFYERKRRGYYIGREAEADAEEKKIERAVVEGRVK